MNRKIPFSACLVLVLLAAIFTYQITYISTVQEYAQKTEEIKISPSDNPKLSEAMEIVESVFVKEIDREYLDDATMLGYILGLQDRHSSYYTKEQFDDLNASMSGNITGIGIRVFTNSYTEVMTVYEVMGGSPADEVGIVKGDIIHAVNDKLYSDIKFDGAYDELLGAEGEKVKVTVKRGEELIDFEIIRRSFETQTVTYKLCETDASIGYVKIYNFDLATSAQFKNAVETLLEGGAESFIFDVRANPGGTLDSVSEILDYLLPQGPIIRMIDKNERTDILYSDKSELSYPMVVLADGDSASAAELFASALMDYDKATFIGVTTYGKGTVQNTYMLSDGSGIRVSVAYYLPPFSESFEGIGITPDIEVALSEESLKNYYMLSEAEDEQLSAAINYLKN